MRHFALRLLKVVIQVTTYQAEVASMRVIRTYRIAVIICFILAIFLLIKFFFQSGALQLLVAAGACFATAWHLSIYKIDIGDAFFSYASPSGGNIKVNFSDIRAIDVSKMLSVEIVMKNDKRLKIKCDVLTKRLVHRLIKNNSALSREDKISL